MQKYKKMKEFITFCKKSNINLGHSDILDMQSEIKEEKGEAG